MRPLGLLRTSPVSGITAGFSMVFRGSSVETIDEIVEQRRARFDLERRQDALRDQIQNAEARLRAHSLVSSVGSDHMLKGTCSPECQVSALRGAFFNTLGAYERNHEHAVVVFFAADGQTLNWTHDSKGLRASAVVHGGEILAEARRLSATSVLVAHNHPNSSSDPSDRDRKAASNITRELGDRNIEVLPFLVLGDDGNFSTIEVESK